jgi:mono/diheme cytochrome c family protein
MHRHKHIPITRLPIGGLLAIATLLLTGIAHAASLPADHAERMTRGMALFQNEIGGILKQNCVQCHGGEKTKGELDLTTREDALRGGKDGPVIVPFDAAGSLLVDLINHAKDPAMPDKKPKLAPEVITKISTWINDGAP